MTHHHHNRTEAVVDDEKHKKHHRTKGGKKRKESTHGEVSMSDEPFGADEFSVENIRSKPSLPGRMNYTPSSQRNTPETAKNNEKGDNKDEHHQSPYFGAEQAPLEVLGSIRTHGYERTSRGTEIPSGRPPHQDKETTEDVGVASPHKPFAVHYWNDEEKAMPSSAEEQLVNASDTIAIGGGDEVFGATEVSVEDISPSSRGFFLSPNSSKQNAPQAKKEMKWKEDRKKHSGADEEPLQAIQPHRMYWYGPSKVGATSSGTPSEERRMGVVPSSSLSYFEDEEGHLGFPGAERVGGYNAGQVVAANDNDTVLIGGDNDGAPVALTSVDVMAQAHLVDDPVVAAEVGADDSSKGEMEGVKQRFDQLENNRRRLLWIAVGVGLFLAMVIIAVLSYFMVERGSSDSSESRSDLTPPTSQTPTRAPTSNPTAAPTPAPSSVHTLVPTPHPTAGPTANSTSVVGTASPITPVPTPNPTTTVISTPNPTTTAISTPSPTTAISTPNPTATAISTPNPTDTAISTPNPTPVPTPVPTLNPTPVPTTSPTENPTPLATTTTPTPNPTTTPTQISTTLPPSPMPSLNPPTTAPTLHFQEETFIHLIQSRMSSISFDSGSEQRRAMDWMLQDSYTLALDDDRIIQRFALAVLYYATDGPTSWNLEDGEWLLSSTSECDWGEESNVECTNSRVDGIWLGNRDVSGSLPKEIGLLSTLTTLDILYNKVGGTIPSEVGLLTSLTGLDLSHNNLVGTIPSEVGLLTSLTDLDLSFNHELSGNVPTELAYLSNLEQLHLYSDLSGTIPSSMCETLQYASVDCAKVECDCCTYPYPDLSPCS